MRARFRGAFACVPVTGASYITFLRSKEVDDKLVQSTAVAMRHSSATAASSSYDKNGTQPLVDRAMKATAAFSAKYTA